MIQDLSVEAEIPGGYYIENSGAVILAQYIPQLFKNLEWTKEEKIVRRSHAVLAIHYATTGHSKPIKNDLLLPGILCGLEMDFVIDSEIILTQVEEQEVNEMLTSVIRYWAVLKTTSIQGFQEAFLKRRGILTLQENGWLLQVEHSGIDILLNTLPWNIYKINLPWMKQILRTEWY